MQGLPGLSRLPVLGFLFGARQKTEGRRELVVLLTPHIWSPDVAMSHAPGPNVASGTRRWRSRGASASTSPSTSFLFPVPAPAASLQPLTPHLLLHRRPRRYPAPTLRGELRSCRRRRAVPQFKIVRRRRPLLGGPGNSSVECGHNDPTSSNRTSPPATARSPSRAPVATQRPHWPQRRSPRPRVTRWSPRRSGSPTPPQIRCRPAADGITSGRCVRRSHAHTVASGETVAMIAQLYYGSARYDKALSFNRGLTARPNRARAT